jgi:hypothetical protein
LYATARSRVRDGALEEADLGERREHPHQLGHLGDGRLHPEDGPLRVEAQGEEVERRLEGVARERLGGSAPR